MARKNIQLRFQLLQRDLSDLEKAEVLEHEYKPENYVPDVAPDDFDPTYAGEVWAEDD